MIRGEPPYYETNRKKMYQRIISEEGLNWASEADEVTRDLVTRLLNKDPRKRLGSGPDGISEIMNHEWFRETDFTWMAEKRVIPPYQPIDSIDYIDSMFLDKDIGRANDPSPPGSMEFSENGLLDEMGEFNYSMYD